MLLMHIRWCCDKRTWRTGTFGTVFGWWTWSGSLFSICRHNANDLQVLLSHQFKSKHYNYKLLDQFFWCFHWFSFEFLLCLPRFPLVSLIAHLLTLSQCLCVCVCVGFAAPSCVCVYMFSGALLYSQAPVPASLFACCFPLLVQLHTVSLFTWVLSPSLLLTEK